MEEKRPLSASLSMQMKVNLGNYESADAFMSVSNITTETTDEELAELLDGPMKIAYEEMRRRFAPRIAALRKKALEFEDGGPY